MSPGCPSFLTTDIGGYFVSAIACDISRIATYRASGNGYSDFSGPVRTAGGAACLLMSGAFGRGATSRDQRLGLPAPAPRSGGALGGGRVAVGAFVPWL